MTLLLFIVVLLLIPGGFWKFLGALMLVGVLSAALGPIVACLGVLVVGGLYVASKRGATK